MTESEAQSTEYLEMMMRVMIILIISLGWAKYEQQYLETYRFFVMIISNYNEIKVYQISKKKTWMDDKYDLIYKDNHYSIAP